MYNYFQQFLPDKMQKKQKKQLWSRSRSEMSLTDLLNNLDRRFLKSDPILSSTDELFSSLAKDPLQWFFIDRGDEMIVDNLRENEKYLRSTSDDSDYRDDRITDCQSQESSDDYYSTIFARLSMQNWSTSTEEQNDCLNLDLTSMIVLSNSITSSEALQTLASVLYYYCTVLTLIFTVIQFLSLY